MKDFNTFCRLCLKKIMALSVLCKLFFSISTRIFKLSQNAYLLKPILA